MLELLKTYSVEIIEKKLKRRVIKIKKLLKKNQIKPKLPLSNKEAYLDFKATTAAYNIETNEFYVNKIIKSVKLENEKINKEEIVRELEPELIKNQFLNNLSDFKKDVSIKKKFYFNKFNFKSVSNIVAIDNLSSTINLYNKSIKVYENSTDLNLKYYVLNISFSRNNIFINFTNNKGITILRPVSPQTYGFKVSKKNKLLFFEEILKNYTALIQEWFSIFSNDMEYKDYNKFLFGIKISASSENTKSILESLQKKFIRCFQQNSVFFIEVNNLMPFNGCRGKKVRRKKGLFLKDLMSS